MTTETTPPKPDFVKIDSILIAERARSVDADWAEVLAASFRIGGMINPVTLWGDVDSPQLVAGAHRIAGQKLNGAERIRVTWSAAKTLAEAKVLETTENLLRHELTALDRAHHLFELKVHYEAAFPEAKAGGDRKSDDAKADQKEIISFRSDAAEKVGLSERAISLAVAMWKNLCPVVKAKVRGTWLADHQAGLMQLSKEKPKTQQKALALIFPPDGGQPKVTNVADALFMLENGRIYTSVEKRFAGLNKSIKALSDEELFAVLAANEERISKWFEKHLGGSD